MDTKKILKILSLMSDKMNEKKDFLTELDNLIADGDHGINMARGFSAVNGLLGELENQDIGAIFKKVGMTLVSVVGGSAGPLYGTAFLKSGMAMAGKTEMNFSDFLVCMNASIEGVMARGRAKKGEKTMLDAMIPAFDAMKKAEADGLSAKEALESGVKAANEGVKYTKTIAATKGRASYIGERSIGVQDPGATSFTYLLEVVAKAL